MTVGERIPSPIETERLLLTPLREGDADEMAGVLASPSLYAFTGGEPPDLETLRRRYAAMAVGHSPDLAQEWPERDPPTPRRRRRTDRHGAGDRRPGRSPRRGRVGRRCRGQGQGYASESAAAMVRALVDAGVRSVIAHIHPDHAASAAVARRYDLAPTDELHDGERRWGRRPAD